MGDTAADPRARIIVDRNAAGIYRFQASARDRAVRASFDQQAVNHELPGGIKLRHIFNQGMEQLQIYVPLSLIRTLPAGGPALGVLAVDVLFAAAPYAYTATYPAGFPETAGQEGTSVMNHAVSWASGLVITTSTGLTFDMVSCAAWGGNPVASKNLSNAVQGAYNVTRVATATDRTLAHPAVPITYGDGSNSSNFRDIANPWYFYTLTPDNIYQDYVGNTFLIYSAYPGETLQIDLWYANLNTAALEVDGNLPSPLNVGYGANLNVQCREFDATAKLVNVTVPVKDKTFTVNLVATPQQQGTDNAGTLWAGSAVTDGPTSSWNFIAEEGWKDNAPAAPVDRTAKHMGDLLYATQDDSTLTPANPAGYFYVGISGGPAPGSPGPMSLKGIYADPGGMQLDLSALRQAPAWPMGSPARAMSQFGTIKYTARAAAGSKGKAHMTAIVPNILVPYNGGQAIIPTGITV